MLELLEEKKKRNLTNDLIDFTSYFFEKSGNKFVVSEHHRQIADALAKVESGEIKNLLINIPPRYGKTELGVINWVAKCIAKNPKSKFIHLSYSDELALDNSSKAKELIESDAYQELWPTKLKNDSKGKKKWYTLQGGGLYATAAGGPITGFGAGATNSEEFSGAIIIDDPLKVDDAQRDGERDKVNNRLNTTIKSRRNSRSTPIIIIMQRLHEDDISGFVLNNGMGEDFYHLKLSAIQEDGTALWPFKHSLEELEIEKKSDLRTFSSQMMQEPTPSDGGIFKKSWFRKYHHHPEEHLRIVQSWDTAVKAGQLNDFSVCTTWMETDKDYYLLDVLCRKMEYPALKKAAIVNAARWEPDTILIEDKASGQSLLQELRLETKLPLVGIEPKGDKIIRASNVSALVESGKVLVPENAVWIDEFMMEVAGFPLAAHDDQVDSMTQFLNWAKSKNKNTFRIRRL